MSNEFETSKYYDNVFERDSDAVFIKVHSEEQELESSCGPAVITDVLKTLGKNVTQLEIIEDVDNELKKMQKRRYRIQLKNWAHLRPLCWKYYPRTMLSSK